MPTLMIPVDETKLKKLQQTASRLSVGVEELVQQSIDDFVYRRERFEDATKYVLEKNAELYRRLAQ